MTPESSSDPERDNRLDEVLTAYLEAIEAAGLRVDSVRQNAYRFLSPRAQAAADKYGVTSVTVLATKP